MNIHGYSTIKMPRYTANFVHTSLSSRRWSRSLCPFCCSALSWSSVSCASWMVRGRRWRASLTGSRKMLSRRTRTVGQRLSCKTKVVHLSLEMQYMHHSIHEGCSKFVFMIGSLDALMPNAGWHKTVKNDRGLIKLPMIIAANNKFRPQLIAIQEPLTISKADLE